MTGGSLGSGTAPTLTAALIVRDEAAHLERCLTSLAGLVDGIVVVDTGSVDDSVAVACRHGAVVDHVPWAGDFSKPRNRSLELVEAEWVLYIDADEEVLAGDHAAFRAQLAGAADHVGFRARFIPRVGWTPYHEYRLWRSDPSIRFTGMIHESIVPAIHAVADRDALRVGDTDLLTIQHYGYEGDQRHKHDRDEPILLAQLERDPERIYLYDHLARIYEAQGESALAVETWMRGIERVRARRAPQHDDRLVYLDLIFHRVANGDTGNDVGELVTEALGRFPGLPALEYAAATMAFAHGDTRGALARLERLVALSLDDVIATGSSYDGRLFGEWAWNLLGLCRFALDDDTGAAAAFERAELEAPSDPAYRTRRRLAEARAANRRT